MGTYVTAIFCPFFHIYANSNSRFCQKKLQISYMYEDELPIFKSDGHICSFIDICAKSVQVLWNYTKLSQA